MSRYSVIFQVSNTLKKVLWNEFQKDSEIVHIVGNSDSAIVFLHPTAASRNTANRLSVWLYQVTENEYVKNQPMQQSADPAGSRFPPLALNLFYLITPFSAMSEIDPVSGQADLHLLGKTMQVLYDNAVIYLTQEGGEVTEELRVVLRQLSLEEQTRIWEALMEPYRLSVCYEVRVIRLTSERKVSQSRVLERNAGFDNKVALNQANGLALP
jgi:Pvc16 N-terminal domain